MRKQILFDKVSAKFRDIGEFPRTAPPAFRAALWLFFAFAASVIVYPDGWVYPGGDTNFLGVLDHFVSHGKTLLYGLTPLRDVRMPLIGFISLAAGNVNWAGMQVLWTLVSFSLLLSAYALGCLLSGRIAGVAAAAVLFCGQGYPVIFFELEQRVYCLFLLLVLNALALSRFTPRARRLAESCAVGISFLARSALCGFPLVLGLLEFFKTGPGSLRRRAASAALAAAVPFIFLLPWLGYNLGVNHTFMLFDGRGEWNIVTGAMGMVSTFEGDHKRLAGIGPGESPLLWSVKRIAGHPAVYLSGVAKRVGFIFSEHPLVLGSWLFFAFYFWRRPGFRRVNILGLYFLAVHLAFSTEERYFLAILPLMAALTAVSLSALLTGDDNAEREGSVLAAAGAVPVAVAAVLCMLTLLYHAAAGVKDRGAVLARALSASPHDAWLSCESGRLKLIAGDYDGAYRSIGEAAVLVPADITCREDLAIAALLKNRRKGRPSSGADLVEKMPLAGAFDFHPGRYYALKALYELDAGRVKQAEQSVRLAMRVRENYLNFKLKSDADVFGKDQARVEDIYITEFLLPELLVYFPKELREKLAPAFIDLYLKNGGALGLKALSVTAASAPNKAGAALPAGYVPGRDAGADIQTALEQARADNKRVLVFVGGDWCDWCEKMTRFIGKNTAVNSLKEGNYVSVKVFYDPAHPPIPPAIAHYPAIPGFPHIYVLASDGTVLKSQDTSQLEHGDTYDRDKLLAFLNEWSQNPARTLP